MQLESSKKIEAEEEKKAIEAQNKLSRLDMNPNLVENLERKCAQLDEHIHQMRTDKHKLEITEKLYKKVTILPRNVELEKKIIYLENQLQEKHEVIFQTDKERADKEIDKLLDKVAAAQQRHNDLMAEDMKLKLEPEEKKTIFDMIEDRAKEEEMNEEVDAKKEQVLNCVYLNTKLHRNHLNL